LAKVLESLSIFLALPSFPKLLRSIENNGTALPLPLKARTSMRLTVSNLLERMQHNRDYNPTYLARQFNETTSVVRDMLCALVEDGRAEMTSRYHGTIRFRRVRMQLTDASCGNGPEPGDGTSVATFPVTRTLSGSMSDYGASLARHQVLAMLTRRG
jgi:hypothetical protein